MSVSRRNFVKSVSITAAGLGLADPFYAFAKNKEERVKLGFIGTGLRGQAHLATVLKRNDADVVAICDVDARMLQASKEVVGKAGKPIPKVYTGDDYAYRELLDAKGIDAIIIATPWEWHKPMIIDSLSSGLKYIATEVVLGITLEDHWEVVRSAERNNAHVMMLENVC